MVPAVAAHFVSRGLENRTHSTCAARPRPSGVGYRVGSLPSPAGAFVPQTFGRFHRAPGYNAESPKLKQLRLIRAVYPIPFGQNTLLLSESCLPPGEIWKLREV